MSKPLLILMTRWPAPTRCKKRLSQDIGASRAAAIQRKLILHTIAVAKSLQEKGYLEIRLAVEGIGSKKISRWASSHGITQAEYQGKGSLGLKMKRQLVLTQRKRSLKSKNHREIIFIGTDVPDLCKNDIISAISYLTRNEIVIGPAVDGGYWLIGFSKNILCPVISWPFAGIRWGSSSVLKETLRKAKTEGVKYELIRKKSDIDKLSDLEFWC